MTETQQRNYRATFILDTRNYEQPIETLVSALTSALTELGATTGDSRNLGRQEFIRVTDKHHTGDVYVQIDLSAPAELPGKVQERFRLDKTVKRVLLETL
ncbi:MAG: 30S ribosomal protein S6 [Opitutales bacterium]|nr:30S ribosomal protein S6 [Opitutales bacterium]